MTELDPQDLKWAENFGARWGAEYPSPNHDSGTISQALTDDAHEPMNAHAIAHQKRVLGVSHDTKLSKAQSQEAAPYLEAIALIVLREVQWAVLWRRDQLEQGRPDPGIGYLVLRAHPEFETALEEGLPSLGTVVATPDDQKQTPSEDVAQLTFRQRRALRKAERRLARTVEHREREARRHASDRDRARQRQTEIKRRRPSAPSPQRYGVNHQGAERLAADWMRHLGVSDATVTKYSGDGGIDVDSRYGVAQVKNLHPETSVPIAHLRDLFGTATHRRKNAVLFTSGRISSNGIEFANQVGMALIRYDAERGSATGLNNRGKQVIALGFPTTFGFTEY